MEMTYTQQLEKRCQELEALSIQRSIWLPKWEFANNCHHYKNSVCIYGTIHILNDGQLLRSCRMTSATIMSATQVPITHDFNDLEEAKFWIEDGIYTDLQK
jgi:hypothetical protein